ncbi:MAG: glycine dehydrogenase subunit 2, partial [bacterium]|nr:glycine dehydrogenase subunit 2 [bacterium]
MHDRAVQPGGNRPAGGRIGGGGCVSNATRGIAYEEPLVFERSRPGRRGVGLPPLDVPEVDAETLLGEALRKEPATLPELSELDVVRHFTRLSTWNAAVDLGLYPLGSCTMKYNPKLNEQLARLPGLALAHPHTPAAEVQGLLELMHELEGQLASVSGMSRVSLQPAAGAQGELAGVMMIRAYHASRDDTRRRKVLIPDSAHGTNPASAALNGYDIVAVPSGDDGMLHPDAVEAAMDDEVAALMMTNPNTLGLFETHIGRICEIVHSGGGLVYGDGANLNALLGLSRPGDMGIDVMHFNLHKTFSTPHGGGGPGAGPVGVVEALEPFLPVPVVEQTEAGGFVWDEDRPQTIGRLHGNHGNVGMMVRAYAYILSLGADGLRRSAEMAVLNANYLLTRLQEHYHVPFPGRVMHECVLSDRGLAETGITTLDVAKRLIDHGYHPPTIYFPLIVAGALMIEPTETESREAL